MAINFPDSDDLIHQMITAPKVGDRFTEFHSFWLYVVKMDGDMVYTLGAGAPCTLPEDGVLRKQTVSEFAERLAYKGTSGYWVRAAGRGHNVIGWYEAKAADLVSAPKREE